MKMKILRKTVRINKHFKETGPSKLLVEKGKLQLMREDGIRYFDETPNIEK